jgi:hypothetical protein
MLRLIATHTQGPTVDIDLKSGAIGHIALETLILTPNIVSFLLTLRSVSVLRVL